MRDKELYRHVLGLPTPWDIIDVELNNHSQEIVIKIELTKEAILVCPHCNTPSPGYDTRVKRWRHLDTCQFHTILEAKLPRIDCQKHGVSMIHVPWAEPGSGYTALFEGLVIDWLQEASTKAVARQFSLSWNAIDGIMQRAVKRGLNRRQSMALTDIHIDETSFKKRHDYVSIVSEKGRVLHVADDRNSESLDTFWQGLNKEQKANIRSVNMDMWPAFIKSVRAHVPDADNKIAFDKFHVAKHLNEAVDKVRKQENKQLLSAGDKRLKGTKYDWLRNANITDGRSRRDFNQLARSTLKTSRAWAIKELAMTLWHYGCRGWAIAGWKKWLSWASRSRLKPVQAAAKTTKKYLWGIINAILLKESNGRAESMNSQIQRVKRRACGFRNKERFKTAIYFHLGGLDLYPMGIRR